MFRYWTSDPQGVWKLVPDAPEARASAISSGGAFFTMLAVEQEPVEGAPEPNRVGDFGLDFDSKEEPAHARDDVRKLMVHLEHAYCVDPYQLRFFVSGGKGFHLEIPAVVYGDTSGDPYLPLIMRRMAARLAAEAELITLDLGIYNMKRGRMWRIQNVRRANGRYKIPVTFDELSLPIDELLELSKAPRELDEDDQPIEPQETDLALMFDHCKAAVYAELERQKDFPPLSVEQQMLLQTNIPACIRFIIDKRPTNQNFNALALQLASCCRDAGLDESKAMALVADFIELRQSSTYDTVEKRRRHFREMFLYLRNSPGSYPFACSYILGMGFPGNAFECRQCPANPDKRPSRADLEAKIQACDDVDELIIGLNQQVFDSGLPESAIEGLSKQIAAKAKCSAKTLQKDALEALTGGKKHEKPPIAYAREVRAGYGADNILATDQGIFQWNACGVWEECKTRNIRQRIHDITPDAELTKIFVDGVVDLFTTEIFRPNHVWDRETVAVNCLNGQLRHGVGGWTLEPHKKTDFRTTQIPVRYDPAAKCPLFNQFLLDVFRDDPDLDEKFALTCQMLGYSLLTTSELEKFILLIGPGANGKSVLLALLTLLVGTRNVSAIQPEQLDNRFQRAFLEGKLVNVVTEIAEGHLLSDAALKSIVSGELCTVERKNKDPHTIQPFATCWFGTNHLPNTRDFSDALTRRAFILQFNRTFAPGEQDPKLKEKLATELPGILNLALEGIDYVMRAGQFTEPASSADAKRQWRLENDQVAQFVEECCERQSKAFCAVKDLFKIYLGWVEESGIKKALSRRGFSSRLGRLGFTSEKSTGGYFRYQGIQPKTTHLYVVK